MNQHGMPENSIACMPTFACYLDVHIDVCMVVVVSVRLKSVKNLDTARVEMYPELDLYCHHDEVQSTATQR